MIQVESADPLSADSQTLIEKLSAVLARITGSSGKTYPVLNVVWDAPAAAASDLLTLMTCNPRVQYGRWPETRRVLR